MSDSNVFPHRQKESIMNTTGNIASSENHFKYPPVISALALMCFINTSANANTHLIDFDKACLVPAGPWREQNLARFRRSIDKLRARNAAAVSSCCGSKRALAI